LPSPWQLPNENVAQAVEMTAFRCVQLGPQYQLQYFMGV